MSELPVDALRQAAGRAEVVEAMRAFYEDVDRRIAGRKPTCWNRGACCRFGEYGHRLYVTALEVVYYLAMQADQRLAPPRAAGRGLPPPGATSSQNAPGSTITLQVWAEPGSADACPHACEGRCHARDRRPLGCRIFYCDPDAQPWQGPFTEECLDRLKRLHRELDVPYFYADWMSVLRSLRECGVPEP